LSTSLSAQRRASPQPAGGYTPADPFAADTKKHH